MADVGAILLCEFAFEPEVDDELLLHPGDKVEVLTNLAPPEDADLWLTGKNLRTGAIGLFPAEGYCILTQIETEDLVLPEAILPETLTDSQHDSHLDTALDDDEDFTGFGPLDDNDHSLNVPASPVLLLDTTTSSTEVDAADAATASTIRTVIDDRGDVHHDKNDPIHASHALDGTSAMMRAPGVNSRASTPSDTHLEPLPSSHVLSSSSAALSSTPAAFDTAAAPMQVDVPLTQGESENQPETVLQAANSATNLDRPQSYDLVQSAAETEALASQPSSPPVASRRSSQASRTLQLFSMEDALAGDAVMGESSTDYDPVAAPQHSEYLHIDGCQEGKESSTDGDVHMDQDSDVHMDQDSDDSDPAVPLPGIDPLRNPPSNRSSRMLTESSVEAQMSELAYNGEEVPDVTIHLHEPSDSERDVRQLDGGGGEDDLAELDVVLLEQGTDSPMPGLLAANAFSTHTTPSPTELVSSPTPSSPEPSSPVRGLTFVRGHARPDDQATATPEVEVRTPTPEVVLRKRHIGTTPEKDDRRESVLSAFDFPPPPGFEDAAPESGRITPVTPTNDNKLDTSTADPSVVTLLSTSTAALDDTSTTLLPATPLALHPDPPAPNTPDTPSGIVSGMQSTSFPHHPSRRPDGRSVIVYDTPMMAQPVKKSLLSRVMASLSPRRRSPSTTTTTAAARPAASPIAHDASFAMSVNPELPTNNKGSGGQDGDADVAMTSFGKASTLNQAHPSDSLLPLRYHAEATSRQKALAMGVNLSARKVELYRGPAGFGFAINGDAPVFVRSVVQHGPADKGLKGLLVNDIILKVNDVGCPLGPRHRVVDLIKATPTDQPLRLVVCRTPTPARKRLPPLDENASMTATCAAAASTMATSAAHPLASGNGNEPIPTQSASSGGDTSPRSQSWLSSSPRKHALQAVDLDADDDMSPTPSPGLSAPPPPLSEASSAAPSKVLGPLFARPAVQNSAPPTLVPVTPPQAPADAIHNISFNSADNSNESHNNTYIEELIDSDSIRRLKDIAESTFSGWLLKLSGVLNVTTRWKRRYVLLFDHRLAYFKAAHPDARPCAVIDLRQCKIQRTKVDGLLYTFRLVSKTHKPLHLQVVNKRMFGNWLERIETIKQEHGAASPLAPSTPAPAPMISSPTAANTTGPLQTLNANTDRPVSVDADTEFASMLQGLQGLANSKPQSATPDGCSPKKPSDSDSPGSGSLSLQSTTSITFQQPANDYAVNTIAIPGAGDADGREFAETCI